MTDNLEEELAELGRQADQLEDTTVRELMGRILDLVRDLPSQQRAPLVFRNKGEVLRGYEGAGEYDLRVSVQYEDVEVSCSYSGEEVSKLKEDSILLTQNNKLHDNAFYYDDYQEKHLEDVSEEVCRAAREEAKNRGHDAVLFNESEVVSHTQILVSGVHHSPPLGLGHPKGVIKYSCKIPVVFYDRRKE